MPVSLSALINDTANGQNHPPHRFEAVLNGLNRKDNLDIYVTGSNSKFLSSDVLTEFRGRGDEVRVYPLSFSEYVSAYPGDKYEAWIDYYTYGGLPLILSRKGDVMKSKYLIDLCRELYLKDIEDRHRLRGDNVINTLVNILASAVGSLTNPTKLAHTFDSNGIRVSDKTISVYIEYLLDAFFINKAERYDIKGKKYIASPFKYYFCKLSLKTVFAVKLFLTGFFIDLFHSAIGQISDEAVMYFDRLNFLTVYPALVAH